MKQVPGPPFSVSHGIIHLGLCLPAQKLIMLPQLEALKKQNGDMGRLFKTADGWSPKVISKVFICKIEFCSFSCCQH